MKGLRTCLGFYYNFFLILCCTEAAYYIGHKVGLNFYDLTKDQNVWEKLQDLSQTCIRINIFKIGEKLLKIACLEYQ